MASSPSARNHEKCEDAADGVGEHQTGSAFLQPAAGPHEKTGTDGSANGDHLEMTILQRLVVAGVAAVLDEIALGESMEE